MTTSQIIVHKRDGTQLVSQEIDAKYLEDEESREDFANTLKKARGIIGDPESAMQFIGVNGNLIFVPCSFIAHVEITNIEWLKDEINKHYED